MTQSSTMACYRDEVNVPEFKIKPVHLHGNKFRPEWKYTVKAKHQLSKSP